MWQGKLKMGTNAEYRAIKIIAIGTFMLLIMSFVSLFLGRYLLSPKVIIEVLKHKVFRIADSSIEMNIVWDIRISRILLNILVGAGLAASGAAFQGIFQNRLVSPDILGVSNGAGFGAALAMFLGLGTSSGIAVLAFGGGITSVLLSYFISKLKKEQTTLALVLSGIIVASFFSALISFLKLVADTESVLPSITYWLMGSFASSTMDKVLFAAVFIGIGLVVLLAMRWKINVLSMGDEEAYTLGIDPIKNRAIIIIAGTFVTAACVTITGIIGWIGMIIPNICREYISADNRLLMPATCVIGALFMVTVDLMARCATAAEIPIGILTAIVGAPIFILVFFKKEGDLT